tara:strand:- start:306 stop:620 length:315 start_codon:yes stop_codon:yes gene_type:complete
MKVSTENELRLLELIDICKKHQGEHLDAHHGSGSWATSYSNFFIDAASEMYVIYKKSGSLNPIFKLSQDFQKAKIRSCRGSVMCSDKVQYLYKSHLKSKIKKYN